MALAQITVMYGHLEGTQGKYARDPSGYLAIEAGIFGSHGLDVSWQHVQGTEERYRRLGDGSAHISLVVGRASLQHFLQSGGTRILGCAMNSCPYWLVVGGSLARLHDLKGKAVACREGPARHTRLAETLAAQAQLGSTGDVTLVLPASDQEVFHALLNGKVQAALLPRPYGLLAEEQGFKRVADWPEVVDDPLPITIETTEALLKSRGDDFVRLLNAHREAIVYLKGHRAEAMRMLQQRFNHTPPLAAKTFDDYLVCMNERLNVEFAKFRELLAQVAPDALDRARQIASGWIVSGALSD